MADREEAAHNGGCKTGVGGLEGGGLADKGTHGVAGDLYSYQWTLGGRDSMPPARKDVYLPGMEDMDVLIQGMATISVSSLRIAPAAGHGGRSIFSTVLHNLNKLRRARRQQTPYLQNSLSIHNTCL